MVAAVLQPAEVPRAVELSRASSCGGDGRAADKVFCTLRFTSEVPASGELRWELRCAILRPSRLVQFCK